MNTGFPVIIVEDHQITRESLVQYFVSESEINVVYATDTVESALSFLRNSKMKPQLMLLDIGLPGMSGLEAIPIVKALVENIDIVMFTNFDEDEMIFSALCSGAVSYISKRTPLKTIAAALKVVHEGGSYMSPQIARKVTNHFHIKRQKSKQLTDRQMEIVHGLVEGKSYKMIAADLFISIETVRTHIKRIYKTLQVNSSLELVKKYNSGNI